jgi:hypothetical protein
VDLARRLGVYQRGIKLNPNYIPSPRWVNLGSDYLESKEGTTTFLAVLYEMGGSRGLGHVTAGGAGSQPKWLGPE